MAIREIQSRPRPESRALPQGKPKGQRSLRLSLVPQLPSIDLSNLNVRSITSVEREQKSFAMICLSLTTAGLLAMFGLNMALTEGAFKVKELKLQVIEMNELREAALTQVSTISSPENLAQSATRLGMIASTTPHFLQLTGKQ
ncbi:MAG: hypothetical protein EBX97_00980 [Actinobacteria bacterium]|jgi:hypothetical protein|nr:hypothetical protein [Actinomycetota bacterium]NDI10595.1 hypothetical protein [Actinomycetota bacterium]